MSAPERLQVELTPFEKLQVLRDEAEARQEELNRVEADIREKLSVQATQKYLESLNPYYAANPRPGLPTREEIDAMEARRAQLKDVIAAIEATIPQALSAKGEAGPSPSAAATATPVGPARKARFDSFDDFRRAKES